LASWEKQSMVVNIGKILIRSFGICSPPNN
jgi:hypothetical protein